MNELNLSPAHLVCFGLATAYSVDEVADKLSVDERTIRSWIAAGELTAFNVSRDRQSRKARLRILETEIDRFILVRSTTPEPVTRKRRPARRKRRWV